MQYLFALERGQCFLSISLPVKSSEVTRNKIFFMFERNKSYLDSFFRCVASFSSLLTELCSYKGGMLYVIFLRRISGV